MHGSFDAASGRRRRASAGRAGCPRPPLKTNGVSLRCLRRGDCSAAEAEDVAAKKADRSRTGEGDGRWGRGSPLPLLPPRRWAGGNGAANFAVEEEEGVAGGTLAYRAAGVDDDDGLASKGES